MASPNLIDKPRQRPRIIDKPRRRISLRRRDADRLDSDTLEAIRLSVSEQLRRQYGQSPSFASDTAGEMVNEAYAEYAEKPEADQAQVRNLPGLLVTTAVRRSIDKARREGRAETLNAITTNRSHLHTTALNSRAAKLITNEWGGRPDSAALTGLPRYRFLAQVTHGGEVSKPFSVHGLQAEAVLGDGRPDLIGELEAAIDGTAGRRSAAEVLADLETLDDRIRTALEQRRREGESGGSPRGEFPVTAGGETA